MSRWEEDGSLICPRCKTAFDVHAWASPDCPGDGEEDEPMTRQQALDKIREETEHVLGLTQPHGAQHRHMAKSRLALAEALADASQRFREAGMGFRNDAIEAERALIRAAGGEE